MTEQTPIAKLLLDSAINPINVAGILDQVLYSAIAITWLRLPDPKPDLLKYHAEAMQQAFGAGFYSGALEEFDRTDVAQVYESLTCKSFAEFEKEVMS